MEGAKVAYAINKPRFCLFISNGEKTLIPIAKASPLKKLVKSCRFTSLDESFLGGHLLPAFNAHNYEKHVADVGSVSVARNEESDSKIEALRDVMEVRKDDAERIDGM